MTVSTSVISISVQTWIPKMQFAHWCVKQFPVTSCTYLFGPVSDFLSFSDLAPFMDVKRDTMCECEAHLMAPFYLQGFATINAWDGMTPQNYVPLGVRASN